MPHIHRITNDGPLAQYFAKYPAYQFDSSKGPSKNFRALCEELHMTKRQKKKARKGFNNALTMEFNSAFGTEETSLESWQSLCNRLKIDPIPDILEECREIVKNTHVNLVDLIDRNEEIPETFESVEKLKNYSIVEGKFFPRENAYAGGLVRNLLREFFHEYRGRRAGIRGGEGELSGDRDPED